MRALEENLYRVSGSLVLAMICLFGFGKNIGIASVTAGCVTAAVLLVVAASVFCGLHLMGRLLMCLSVVGCLMAAVVVAGREAAAGFVRGYLAWLWGEPAELLTGSGAYPYLQIVIVSVGCFLFHLLSAYLRWLERIAAGALLAGLVAAMLTGRGVSHLCVVFVLVYAAIVCVRWTGERWDKRKNNSARPFIAWILPFLGIYLLLMALMPAPDQPYGWPIVRRVYHNLRETIVTISENYFSGDGEDFASLGFSGGGNLLGGVQADDEEIMTLTVESRRSGNIYLSGKVYDQFTGRQWRQTDSDPEDERRLDAMETLCALYGYDMEHLSAYLSSEEFDVSYRYFHTRHLFAPLKTWGIAEEGKKFSYKQTNGGIVFSKRQSYGTHYTVNYFRLNVGHEAFDRFVEAGQELDAASWQRVQREYDRTGSKRTEPEELMRYREQIHELYGKAPVLSERVSDWVDGVTEGAESEIGKLRALETALSKFSYTRAPGTIPEDVDSEEEYLDCFLLESRKGFCSYFATAFVLLARAQGLPARYVEGYCVPVAKKGETNVYSYMSHAWPEVYFDGVGWIPFEPTPGFGKLRYTPWKTTYDQDGKLPEFDEAAWREWLASQGEQQEEQQPAAEIIPEENSASGIWKVVGYALLVNLILAVVVLRLVSLIRARLRAKWDVGRLFEAEVKRNLQILALLGYRRQPWETIEALERRVRQGLETEETGEWKLRFLNLYEEVLYAERAVDAKMLVAVQKEARWLEELLREREYRRYLYYRLIQTFL